MTALTPLAFWLLLAGGSDAHADAEVLKQAQAAIDGLEPDKAVKPLQKFLKESGTAASDQVTAHWLLALSYTLMEKRRESDAELDKLLALAPLYEPKADSAPAEMLQRLSERGQKYRKDHMVVLQGPALEGGKLTVQLTQGEKEVSGAKLQVRIKGEDAFKVVTAALDGKAITAVLGDVDWVAKAQAAGGLQFALAALNRSGMPVAVLGTTEAPHLVEVRDAGAQAAAVGTEGRKVESTPSTGSPGKDGKSEAKGHALRAVLVGTPLLVSGILAVLVGLVSAGAGVVTLVLGVLQYRDYGGPDGVHPALRVGNTTATALAVSCLLSGAIMAIGGVLVMALLRG